MVHCIQPSFQVKMSLWKFSIYKRTQLVAKNVNTTVQTPSLKDPTPNTENILFSACGTGSIWVSSTVKPKRTAEQHQFTGLNYLRNIFLFFNWSIVDLQCLVNFYCTAKWVSYMYICFMFFSIMVYHRILIIVPCLSILYVIVCIC